MDLRANGIELAKSLKRENSYKVAVDTSSAE